MTPTTTALPLDLDGWEQLWRLHTIPFLRALSGVEDPEQLKFCWQIVDDAKLGHVRQQHFTEILPRARLQFISAQRQGGGVFVTVNETDGKGRTKDNITRIRALWADIDHAPGVSWETGIHTDNPHVGLLRFNDGEGTPEVPVTTDVRVPLAPSIVVQTRKGFHLYWLVNEGITKEQAHELLWWASVWCRGDPKTTEVARVLRLPGSFHLKNPTQPFLVHTLECTPDRIYSLEELEQAFPAVPGRERPRPQGLVLGSGTLEFSDDEARWAAEQARGYLAQRAGAVEGQHGDAWTFETAARVADFVADEETAVALLTEWNQRCTPPWTDQELRAKWAHATQYRQQPVGAELVLERQVAGIRELVGGAEPPPAMGNNVIPFPSSPGAPPPVPGVRGAPLGPGMFQAAPGAAPPPPGAPPPGPDPISVLNSNLWLEDKGGVKAVQHNLHMILKLHPAWAGVLRFNSFRKSVDVTRPMPLGLLFQEPEPYVGPLRDADASNISSWLQYQYRIKVSAGAAQEAIESVSRTQPYHPVRDYLRGLKWDGVSRVDTWLQRYMGAQITDPHRPGLARYVGLVGRFWLISAVARVLDARSKVDTMLILEGLQGVYKSEAFRTLAVQPEWFSDAKIDVEDKDTLGNMAGVWIWEMAELDGMGRAEVGSIKAFLVQQENRFRAPYARNAELHRRQTVFCGTVNHNSYLRDDSGARRFWPVTCSGGVDIEALRADVHQLWAETVALHALGELWWPKDPALAPIFKAEQDERYQDDVWTEAVAEWVTTSDPKHTTSAYVLQNVLGVEKAQMKKGEQLRVAAILRRLGWTPCRMPNNALVKGWARPAKDVVQPDLIG